MQPINTTSLNEARKQIQKLKQENPDAEIIIQAQDDNFNRKILENPETDILLDPHLHNRRDYMKQRDSGLNEILCKIAKQNNIKIGINLASLQKLSKKQKAITLARIKQNIQLCKRTKTSIILFPKNLKKQDVQGFLISLGASTEQAKETVKKPIQE